MEGGFGPFTMPPPGSAKDSGIVGGSCGPVILGQSLVEDRTRPCGMPVTSDQKHAPGMERSNASGNVERFGHRGIFFKRANTYPRCHVTGILAEKGLSVFSRRVAEEVGVRRC